MGETYAERMRQLYRGMTHEQVTEGCRNFGIDLTCGSCAAVFYAGAFGYAHDPTCVTVDALKGK